MNQYNTQQTKKLLLTILYFTLTFILITGCDSRQENSENNKQPSLSQKPLDSLQNNALIVAFGNSLTAGLGVTIDEAYPAQLQKKLTANGYKHHVLNMGISGETTAGALRRLPSITKLQPKVVILELGANDGLRGLRIEETKNNLSHIIEQLHKHEITVLLTGMKLPPNYGPIYSESFTKIFSTLAEKHGTPFMPFFLKDVATKPALNQRDGIHPTKEGYTIITKNLWPILIPLLEKP